MVDVPSFTRNARKGRKHGIKALISGGLSSGESRPFEECAALEPKVDWWLEYKPCWNAASFA
jgi:hypothetical protein